MVVARKVSYQINPWLICLDRDEEGRKEIISLSLYFVEVPLNCNVQTMIEVEYRKNISTVYDIRFINMF
jgi:hypothetical protein